MVLARRSRTLLLGCAGIARHLTGRMIRRVGHSAEVWDAQFRSGHWSYLDSGAQVAHYAVIAAYVRQLFDQPRILDIGCGHGRLFQVMRTQPYALYHGIDLSTVAIEAARSLGDDRAMFTVSSYDSIPTGQWDAIIFNESLYYSPRPIEVLRRYAACLAERGVFIISMHEHRRRHRAIWRAAEIAHETLLSSRIQNELGQRWNVRVLAPRRGPTRESARA